LAVSPIVVDASIIAKWFLEEPLTEAALKLMEAYVAGRVRIAAPNLMPYEVLNALRFSERFTEDQLAEAAKALESYGFMLYGLAGEVGALTARLAKRLDLTVYDASYVALARILGTTVYTADRELIAKAGEARDIRELEV
jgi:predicted nucleic acid-binding protein